MFVACQFSPSFTVEALVVLCQVRSERGGGGPLGSPADVVVHFKVYRIWPCTLRGTKTLVCMRVCLNNGVFFMI